MKVSLWNKTRWVFRKVVIFCLFFLDSQSEGVLPMTQDDLKETHGVEGSSCPDHPRQRVRRRQRFERCEKRIWIGVSYCFCICFTNMFGVDFVLTPYRSEGSFDSVWYFQASRRKKFVNSFNLMNSFESKLKPSFTWPLSIIYETQFQTLKHLFKS